MCLERISEEAVVEDLIVRIEEEVVVVMIIDVAIIESKKEYCCLFLMFEWSIFRFVYEHKTSIKRGRKGKD